MMKICKKIPMIAAAIVIGVLSVSLTAYAYFSYAVQAKVEKIQTAGYAINITPVQAPAVAAMSVEEETAEDIVGDGQEGTTDSLVCSGSKSVSVKFADLGITETEETEVSFKLAASGTTTAGGYCMITVGDKVYYTNPIAVGEDYVVTIKGNINTVMNVNACWGSLDTEEENAGVKIIGNYVSVEEPSPASSETPSPAPSATPSAPPSASPSAEPSATPSVTPSASPSVEPSATPSAMPSAPPSASPSTEPSATPSTEPSTTPSASPSAETSATPSASLSEEPSETQSEVPSLES